MPSPDLDPRLGALFLSLSKTLDTINAILFQVAHPSFTVPPASTEQAAAPLMPVALEPAGEPEREPPQAAPKNPPSSAATWTPERVALLRELYPTELPADELLARLNALPAVRPIASTAALWAKASLLNLHRPAEVHARSIKEANAVHLARVKGGSTPPAPTPVWTSERRDLVRQEYLDGVPIPYILAHANDLPGPKIASAQALRTFISATLKLSRADGPACFPAPPQPEPKPAPVVFPPPGPDGKIIASFAQIAAWAQRFGIRYDGGNIDRVNKMRSMLHQPPLLQDGP